MEKKTEQSLHRALTKQIEYFQSIKKRMSDLGVKTGPAAWGIIAFTLLLFFFPYILPGNTYLSLRGYPFFALVPIMTGAFLRLRRGALLAWFILTGGLIGKIMLDQGLSWSSATISSISLGSIGGGLFSVLAGQIAYMSNQLTLARTKAQQAEKQVTIAYEQQRQLNEIKDQFIINVSHELRTPLTEVYGYLELLADTHLEIDSDLQHLFLKNATQGCEELLHLVNSILDALQVHQISKIPQREIIAVSHVISETLERFDPHKQQEYSIVVNVAPDLRACANRQYFIQIMRNLLSNAFKYCPRGTTITISAETERSVSQKNTTPAYVRIAVKDTGPGIKPKEIPLLFEKFVRIKSEMMGSVRGTGLGLYICKQLVTAMDGKIWLESRGIAGEGCCFFFTLPCHPPLPPPPQTSSYPVLLPQSQQ